MSVREFPASASNAALAPLLVVTFAIAVLTLMDSVVKGLMLTVPLLQVILLRYLFGALAAFPVFLAVRPKFSWRSLKANALRSIVVVGTATTFFYAIKTLPLAEALALSFLSPMFLALIAAALLGERVPREVIGAIALGFVGVLIILSGKLDGGLALDGSTLTGVAAALASAVFYALANVLLRKQAAFDPPPVIVFTQTTICVALMSPVLLFIEPVPLGARDLGLFALVGALGTIGHLAMAWGYGRVEAARLGPLEYTSFLWGSALGYALFDERLAPQTLVGAALIVSACLLTARKRAI